MEAVKKNNIPHIYLRVNAGKLKQQLMLAEHKCTHVGVRSAQLGRGIDERLVIARFSSLAVPAGTV